MNPKQLLMELERMTNKERLEVIEVATRLLQDSVAQSPAPQSAKKMEQQLVEAAQIMRVEYAAGGDLTALTALDVEDFRDA